MADFIIDDRTEQLAAALSAADAKHFAMAMTYCLKIEEHAEVVRTAIDIDEVTILAAQRMVDPIVETALECETPDELMPFLRALDSERILEELYLSVGASSLDEKKLKRW